MVGGLTAVAQDAFTVNSGAPGDVDVSVHIPSVLRPWQLGTVTVEYANVGETDIVAPLLLISSEGALLRMPGETGFTESAVLLLGINPDGPAGILAPGEGGTATLIFRQFVGNGGTVTTRVAAVSESDIPIDWSSLKDGARPNFIPVDAWNAIWTNFTASVGNTVGDLIAVLSDNATRLSQLGNYTDDIGELLAFELQQAESFLPGATLTSAFDVVAPAPGLPLTFGRTYLASLSDRYRIGPLGRSWTSQWDISATTDSGGNVQLHMAWNFRYFSRQADGSYVSVPGESGVLSVDSGKYRLREADGTVFTFQSDGKLNYIEYPNGNRISALCTDGRLTSLVHSNGDSITLSYNAQGRISQLIDPAEDITTYTYDESGEHLIAVTDPWGTTQYTYDLGQGTARQHALLSIGYPGGTHRYFEYDDQGRLVRQYRDSLTGLVSYNYDTAGGVSITDAAGATSTLLLNNLGQVGQFQDALGRSTRVRYDERGNPVLVAVPGDLEYSFEYDEQGNVTRGIDPLGNSVGFTYDPVFSRLLSVSDPRGNVTRYSYDDKGNPIRITYPDGSSQQASYDLEGNIKETINARDHAIHYTYDDRGLVIRKEYVDGSHADFTYDDHGNMLTATDVSGTTTMEYDSRNLLTQITYPSSRFVSFSYDEGGRRTQMSDQDGFTVNYVYDAGSRLERLTDSQGATVVSYTYDAADRLIRKSLGNGTYTTYDYDVAGQLLHLVNYAPNGSVNSRFDYTYDDLGQCTSMTTLEGDWAYTYDAIGQLTHAAFNSTNPSIPNQNLTYVYDASGNRIRTIENNVTTEYTTNNMNQYTMVGGVRYEYDADGNLVAKIDGADVWTYSYDDENELMQVTTPEGSWTYQYDAFGNRVATVSGGQRIEYLLDPAGLGNIIGEYDGSGSILANYTYGLGLTSRKDATGQTFYYDFDAIGSTIGLTGSDGRYLNNYSYLPFGESFTSTEAIVNPFGYVGEWGVVTEENGLQFMRARYYDSATGRFLNMDPIGLLGGDTNLYSYVANDPINWVDPWGLTVVQLPWRLPDYISADVNVSLPIPGTRKLIGWSGQASLDRYGNLYWSPLGGNLGKSLRLSGSFAAGWLNDGGKPSEDRLKSFLSGHSFNLSGGFWGGVGLTWVPGVGTATEIGFFTPQVGVSYHYSWLWKKIGIEWDDIRNSFERDYTTRIIQPKDPNDIVGPEGFGQEHWLTASQPLPYTIHFENATDATAPAQQVVITDQLDPDLDPRTFRVDDFGWGNLHFELPGNQSFYNQRLDLRQDFGFFVDASATIDVRTGLATWVLTTIDPATGEQPLDASVGFLPPDNGMGSGQGFVSYSVRPWRPALTGNVIDGQARIIFDTEEPIDTPPIFNTLDAVAPTSAVSALPENTDSTEFLVSWSGNDDENGSAVGNFTIFVSDNGSGFESWVSNTSRTEATFSGQSDHSYAFYSVAQDNAGNMESAPSTPDAHVTVLGTGRIEGVNFEDVDGDSFRDDGESALSGWTIYLDQNQNNQQDEDERFAITDAQGAYLFSDLYPDTYVVAEVLQANWVQTTPIVGIYNVAITGGLNVTGRDFGNRKINDAPVNTVPAPQVINEDTVLVFSFTTGNPISIGDEDVGNNPVQVTMVATNGVLTLGGTVGLTFTAGDGTSDGTMTFSGTLASINVALDRLQFEPLTNFNGQASLELTTNDLGNTGAGGPKSDTDLIPITVPPVNDAPVANDDTIVTDEDSAIPIHVLVNDIDVDIGDTLTVSSIDLTGTIGVVTLVDGLITYDPNHKFEYLAVGETASDTFAYTVSDCNGATDTATVTITLTGVNDAPTTINDIYGTDEDTVLSVAPSGVLVNDADVDASDILSVSSIDTTGTIGIVTWDADGSFTYNPNGQFEYLAEGETATDTFSYTASDGSGATGTAAVIMIITGINDAPRITSISLDQAAINENGTVSLIGQFTDPDALDAFTLDVAWGDPLSPNNIEQYTFGAGTTSFSLAHQYLDDSPSATPSDNYAVDLTLTDNHGSEYTDSATVTINNVAPVITSVVSSAPEVGDAAPRDVVTVRGFFTDIGALDTHTAVIDWGDGTVTSAVIDEAASSFSGAHVYATGGIYDIVVNLSDDDSGTVEKQTAALVTGARVKDGELQVVGTHGNDWVDINQVGKKLYKVHAGFLPGRGHFATFDVADVESIKILLGDGNDHATIADNIDLPVFIDGGAGNDHLNAGRGPAMLVGGDGKDKLIGSRADDRIFGGNGNDVILGDGGNDLLDGGAGNDMIFGSYGDDTILGGDGNDWVFGGSGDDVIDGGAGDDKLIGGRGNDKISGGEGHDWIVAGIGNDTVDGGIGDDWLFGGPGDDVISGGDGNDLLVGGRGNDTLDGGAGKNRLIDRNASYLSSPSWVRQFVLNLGGGHKDPNSDIRVTIPGWTDPQHSGLGSRRKGSVA